MKTTLLTAAACLVILAGCKSQSETAATADPMVGTGFHGHTYPGATVPFGAVQLSPDTRAGDWDASSGYHYSDSTLEGFSHTHLSGTGCTDLGDVLFRPVAGPVDISAERLYAPARFSHDDETACPGYYSVVLPDDNIKAELTATTHTGVHRYTFADDAVPTVIVDLDHLLTDENITEAAIEQTAPDEITGVRVTDGWTPGHHVFFTARFSQPFASAQILRDGHVAVLTFENTGRPIEAAVGISGVSRDNARENLIAEVTQFDFDSVRAAAEARWAEALGVITVEGGTAAERANFYTALYHTMLAPTTVSDVNGQFRRNNGAIATDSVPHYSTLSLWDTYRAHHPLLTLIAPELTSDIIVSMLDIYDATGELPVWPLASGETGTMIGYHSVSVIADAWLKGIRGFDPEHALEAMVASSNATRKGADIWGREGFIPSNFKRESVSCAIEYSYDDWCIARMAESLGRNDIAATYYARAANYANLFDGSTRFFRGRRADGNWERPFNPSAVSRDLTEATPWQYRFGAVHDVNGMISLFGGLEPFEAALDSIFTTDARVEGDLADLTGLIGQYAHGNEPSHHVAYLYNYIGKPWKTQEMTRRLLDEMYQPTPEGICGNEDCGQMSAWYVLTSLGLYAVAPGSGEFALTTPLFEKATIKLPGDTTLVITANDPARNRYIRSVSLNGVEIDRNFVDFSQLIGGGTLAFELTDKPFTGRGTVPEAAPASMSRGKSMSVPFIDRDIYLFVDSISVELGCATPGAEIRYTLDGTEPTRESALYSGPVVIDRTTDIRAIAFGPEGVAPSRTMKMTATRAEFKPALSVTPTTNGVDYTYYEGICERTADITAGRLIERGRMERPSIDGARADDHFAYIFSGLIDVPVDGIYTFRTTTDDGSVLIVDGETVVNNDGGHAPVAATGMIALRKGIHQWKLLYFEDYEGQAFDWDWRLPSAEGFTPIPDSRLFVR